MEYKVNKSKLYNLTKEYLGKVDHPIVSKIAMPKMIKCEYRKYGKTYKLSFSVLDKIENSITVESLFSNGELIIYATVRAFPQDWHKTFVYNLENDSETLKHYGIIEEI